MGAEEVAELLHRKLADHLRSCKASRLVVATHTLGFHEQVHRRPHPGWQFVNAFMGSYRLGELIRSDSRVELAIAGHTHLGSDLQFGRLRAMVSPLGYRKEWNGADVATAVAKAMQVVSL
jgi:hypothetical protein